MPRPTEKTLAALRGEVAARVGFGGMAAAAQNAAKLNGILQDAQEHLYERLIATDLVRDRDVRAWVAPTERQVAYPDELDPDRLHDVFVDYTGETEWYRLAEGINYSHDSIPDLGDWPRRYERQFDVIDLWPVCEARVTLTVTGISQANPAIVTVAETLADHGVVDGQRVYLSGHGGMVELADAVYTVDAVTGASTFELHDAADVAVDATGYTAYTSGGTVGLGYQLRFEGVRRLGAFSSDSDTCTLPSRLVKLQALVYAMAEYRRPEAQVYEASLRKLIAQARGRVHGNKRYIPIGRSGAQRSVEAIRPKLVSS